MKAVPQLIIKVEIPDTASVVRSCSQLVLVDSASRAFTEARKFRPDLFNIIQSAAKESMLSSTGMTVPGPVLYYADFQCNSNFSSIKTWCRLFITGTVCRYR